MNEKAETQGGDTDARVPQPVSDRARSRVQGGDPGDQADAHRVATGVR